MILVVAEKPSVGRDIARVLKCAKKGDNYLSGDEYIITWAFGHLVTLMEPDEIDERYKKWRAEDLPILPDTLPTKVIPRTRSQFSTIKKLMGDSRVDRIICATDAGREGELIFGLIYEKAGCKKPVDRLWISSMTDAAIKEGFESLKPRSHYDGLYRSAVCRSEADWLVGMNASRAFTLAYGALLSLGRVQTPTLAILVRRAEEIQRFVPEDYHLVTANFGDFKGLWFDPSIKEEKLNTRIKDKELAGEIAKKIRKKQAAVTSVTKEEKKEFAPQLYDLTSLQRDANRFLGFTADKTLKTAQSLYESRKAITYPRTDSRYLPHDMRQGAMKSVQALKRHYEPLTALLPADLPTLRRVFDDGKVSDHHAIIPTPQSIDPMKLTGDERALYEMVVKRFVAAFLKPFIYEQTRVVTQCEGENFKTTGRVVLDQGWKAAYADQDKDDQEGVLPELAVGDERQVAGATVKRESTKPPPQHNDASLLAAMEQAGKEIEDEALREQMKGSGLGTPATRAAIIERLIKVGYAQRRGKALIATEKGEKLIAVAPEEIASPEMTGRWELALNEIAQGKRDTARFMEGIRRLTSFLVNAAQADRKDVIFEKEIRGKGGKVRVASKALPDVSCPLCGKAVQENPKAFGCSAWRSGCQFTLWKDGLKRGGGPGLTAAIVLRLLSEGRVKGSTGVISLEGESISFTRSGQESPALTLSIRYEKRGAKKGKA